MFVATRDDAFHLGVGGWLQLRGQVGSSRNGVQETMSIPVGRINVGGHAFGTTDFLVSGEVGQGVFQLRDAYLDQPAAFGHLQIGQFKPPFSQEQLTEPVYLEFTDRPITFDFAGIDRDLGVALHGEPARTASGITWAAGVFGGNGITPTAQCTGTTDPITMAPVVLCPTPTAMPQLVRPLAVARVGYASAFSDPHREGDLDHGRPRLAFGVGYAGDLARLHAGRMVHLVTADVVFKLYGWSLTYAAFVQYIRQQRTTSVAMHAQVGYMVVPRLFELAARFAQVPVGAVDQQEMLGVADIYRRGHDLKVQIEGGGLRTTGTGGRFDWVARLQTQLLF